MATVLMIVACVLLLAAALRLDSVRLSFGWLGLAFWAASILAGQLPHLGVVR